MSKLKAKYSLHLFVHECSWKGKYMHIYIYVVILYAYEGSTLFS